MAVGLLLMVIDKITKQTLFSIAAWSALYMGYCYFPLLQYIPDFNALKGRESALYYMLLTDLPVIFMGTVSLAFAMTGHSALGKMCFAISSSHDKTMSLCHYTCSNAFLIAVTISTLIFTANNSWSVNVIAEAHSFRLAQEQYEFLLPILPLALNFYLQWKHKSMSSKQQKNIINIFD